MSKDSRASRRMLPIDSPEPGSDKAGPLRLQRNDIGAPVRRTGKDRERTMPFILQLIPNPANGAAEATNLPAHLAYLEANKDKLMLSGALLGADGKPNGGLIVLDVADKAAAEKFVADDPFTKAQVFSSVVITPYFKTYFNYAKA
jgi:uncharacterized protein YciI